MQCAAGRQPDKFVARYSPSLRDDDDYYLSVSHHSTAGKSKVALCLIVHRVLFLAHGKVIVCRVLFSGTRRSQVSPCAFYLTHGEVIVCCVFF